MAVTITQLSAFLAVVRHGSAKAAAEELVVTQPSVSAAIAALEREVGAKLTERAGRNVRPTAAGTIYAQYAEHVLGLLREGAALARGRATRDTDRLRIGAVTTAGEVLLPPLIEGFRRHWPDLELTLYVGNREDVFLRLARHEVDVAITGRVPENAQLVGQVFADNEFVLITSPRDPLCQRHDVAIDELTQRSWLVREPGSGTRTLVENFLELRQIQPPLLTLGSNWAIKNAVRAGLGVALQPRAAVDMDLRLGLVAPIRARGPLPKRSWFVVRSAVGPVPEPVASFIDFVQSAEARIVFDRAREQEVALSPGRDGRA